jgi:hypothetical protein
MLLDIGRHLGTFGTRDIQNGKGSIAVNSPCPRQISLERFALALDAFSSGE